MTQRDTVSWNSMISGYSQHGRVDDARVLFDSFMGKNVRTWTAMLTGYAKNGRIEDALYLFDSMPERNVVSWNAMVSGFVHSDDLVQARELFEEMPERNIASWNSIVTGYCHCGRMSEARELFDRMVDRNEVSWMAMISGYVQTDEFWEAWDLFTKMHRSEVRPDQSIFVGVLSAITNLNKLVLIENLRTLTVKTGYEEDVVVGTAILNTYTKNGYLDTAITFFETMLDRNEYSWASMITAFSQFGKLDDAIILFNRVPERNVATQTAMMTAYAQYGRINEAKNIFDEIENPNVITWNAMLAGFAQSGMLEEAQDIFLRMPVKNSASWAAMISGLAQNGQSEQSLELLAELHRSGANPSHSSFTSALFACANIGAIEVGKQIHSLTIKTGCKSNSFVGNALISMYANHILDDARKSFEKMSKRDVVSWTAIISAYVQAGLYEVGLKLFIDMLGHETKPNESTFTSLLSACGSLGVIKLGEQIHSLIYKVGFNSCIFVDNALITMYFKCGCEGGFGALVYHYTCMVDLLGRAGRLSEALSVIHSMPVEPDTVIWESLLAACRIHRNINLGQRLAERLFKMGTQKSGVYVLLSNIYASQGMWDKVGEIRKLMVDRGVNKEPAISWINIKNKLHFFLTGDKGHDQVEEIDTFLKMLYQRFKSRGYVPDTNFVLHDVEEEQKQNEILYHSEKMAVAFGIMNTPNGSPIQIMKNLRICGDCHTFMKFVSRITKRKIIVRDGNRFHHFRNGSCSCGDYW